MRWAGIFVAAVIGAGCGENKGFTELRMLVETDLAPPEQVYVLQVLPLDEQGTGIGREHPSFPFVVGISPGGAALRAFGLTVQLRPDALGQVVLLSRSVRDLAFVEGQGRMFVLPLLARCQCQGTACPGPGDPDCDDLSAPVLAPLDEQTIVKPDLTYSPPPLPVTP